VAQGEAYLDQNDYEQAITAFSEAIRLDPGNAQAYGSRGLAYYRQGKYERAIADYDRAIELDSNNPVAYTQRGGCAGRIARPFGFSA
jgi:Flp pilus assembly protein TadD